MFQIAEYGENGTFVFSDCGLNVNPNAEELAEIAHSSSKSFEQLTGKQSKIAMLSYSTYGSAKSELTEKVINATELVKQNYPELQVDGELQLDAAIIPEIADMKAPGSDIKGMANTLIFPDLNAGNIGYKLTQRFAKAEAYGPLCQGIAKPVNDLSRGCNSKDIEGVVAIYSCTSTKIIIICKGEDIMKILVLNCGSSSLKYQLINMETDEVMASGKYERIGEKEAFITHKVNGQKIVIEHTAMNHEEAVDFTLKQLVNPEYKVIDSLDEINAIGHRLVHGGEK